MRAARMRLCACLLLFGPLLLAPGQESSSGAGLKLTCLNHDQLISRRASYRITWSARNIEPNTVLSLRIQWTSQVSGMRVGGVSQPASNSWLIGMLMDSATLRRMASAGAPVANFPTIESGGYLWDADAFCKHNQIGGKSVCDGAARYRLQAILRSASDPCADNLRCGKPRSLFRVYASTGTFAFRE